MGDLGIVRSDPYFRVRIQRGSLIHNPMIDCGTLT